MWEVIQYFLLFLLFAIRLDSVDGAVFILPEQPKPAKFAHKEGCYIPDLDKVVPYEKPYSPQDGKSCMQYTCNRDNTTSGYTCGALGIPENCTRVPGNLKLPYPKCCDGISCPKPVKEDPNPEEIPEVKDDSTDIDPPVGPSRPCPTRPYPPGNPVPAIDKLVSPPLVDPVQEEPSDSVPPVIPPNAPRAPRCAYFASLPADLREIPPYCPPIRDDFDDVTADEPVVESADEPKDESVDPPEKVSEIEPVLKPAPLYPVQHEPEFVPTDTLPTNPVCVYPTNVSPKDMHATVVPSNGLPYCPGVEPVIRPDPVVETVAEDQPAPLLPVETAAETKDTPVKNPGVEPVIGPVADPVVEPVVENQPAPSLPVESEPVLYPNDPLPILKRPKRPPTDPVCVYPTDVSADDMHATSALKRPPYCPPIRDEPVPLSPVSPQRPPKICYSVTDSSDSPTNSFLCPPPAADNPIVESSESESPNPPIYHGPFRTLPVQPPVDS